MALREYRSGTSSSGRMGRTIGESELAWPAPIRTKDLIKPEEHLRIAMARQ